MPKDDTIRTPKGAYISFDVVEGQFLLNILSGINSLHVEMSEANMEDLIDLIGRVYYGAIEETGEDYLKRLIKEAIGEDRHEELKRQGEYNMKVLQKIGWL